MNYICISCWKSFELEEELQLKGGIISCPHCGESQKKLENGKISGVEKYPTLDRESNGFKKPSNVTTSILKKTTPYEKSSSFEQYFVRSPTEFVYGFKNIGQLQNWSQILENHSKYMISVDNTIWKDFAEFLDLLKRSGNGELAFSKSRIVVDEREKISLHSPTQITEKELPVVQLEEKEEKRQKPLQLQQKAEIKKTPLPIKTSDFIFKISEGKEKKPKWVIYLILAIAFLAGIIIIFQIIGINSSF